MTLISKYAIIIDWQ